jgi:hypothetical protein
MKVDDVTGRVLNTTPKNLVAELTAAAYVVALRRGAGGAWLDLSWSYGTADAATEVPLHQAMGPRVYQALRIGKPSV